MLIPVATASIALTAALAGYVMVKFFGVVFLGRPREEKLNQAHDANLFEKIGMAWLAIITISLGLAPNFIIRLIDPVTRVLVNQGLAAQSKSSGWWLLTPTSVQRASYGPLYFLLGVAGAIAIAFILVRIRYHARLRRSAAWGGGHPWANSRMQDTAEGYGQPIREVFETFFAMKKHLPKPEDTEPRYEVIVEDKFWNGLYMPIVRATEFASAIVGRLQRGRISIYLLYSFITLIFLLILVTGIRK
jgi:NADH:ubiquinone oxidoreductase subunit 5 (subunit L)/multisubunit Na+/H+ antiporter MnhA subunit